MSDPYLWPPTGVRAVTPNDSTDLPNGACKGLYINVAGNVVIHPRDSDTPVTLAVGNNQHLPIQVKRVLATGTTAMGVFALY